MTPAPTSEEAVALARGMDRGSYSGLHRVRVQSVASGASFWQSSSAHISASISGSVNPTSALTGGPSTHMRSFSAGSLPQSTSLTQSQPSSTSKSQSQPHLLPHSESDSQSHSYSHSHSESKSQVQPQSPPQPQPQAQLHSQSQSQSQSGSWDQTVLVKQEMPGLTTGGASRQATGSLASCSSVASSSTASLAPPAGNSEGALGLGHPTEQVAGQVDTQSRLQSPSQSQSQAQAQSRGTLPEQKPSAVGIATQNSVVEMSAQLPVVREAGGGLESSPQGEAGAEAEAGGKKGSTARGTNHHDSSSTPTPQGLVTPLSHPIATTNSMLEDDLMPLLSGDGKNDLVFPSPDGLTGAADELGPEPLGDQMGGEHNDASTDAGPHSLYKLW